MIFQEPMTSLNPVLTIGRQIGETLRAAPGAVRPAMPRRKAVEMLRWSASPSPAARARSTRTSFRAACASA